jgi:hypothetical protein
MKKVIKIDESDLQLIVKKVLVEALGVPDGILESSEELYDKFINESEKIIVNKQDEYKFYFDVDYTIGDLNIDQVTITIDTIKNKNVLSPIIQSLGTPFESVANGDSEKLKIVSDFTHVKISITYIVPEDWDVHELLDSLKYDRKTILIGFSHELKHIYDNFKYPYDYAPERASYESYQKLSFGITPIDEFIHFLYFIHAVENLVRPTEIAMAIRLDKVNHINFLKFLTSDDVYTTLKRAQNFSYENLKKQLHDIIPALDDFSQKTNIDLGNTDDEKVDNILNLVYVNLVNLKGESYMEKMVSNIFEKMMGFQGKKHENFKKFIRKIQNYNTYEDFFKAEEKLFKIVSDKMIRKISKVYAMTTPKNKSIKEWDLYHETNETIKNITTEIKFKKN